MDIEIAKSSIIKALKRLLDEDEHLIERRVNERSLTHRLAIYLEEYFMGYDIDCEYNRSGEAPKEIYKHTQTISSDDTEATTVYPDIIIHKRGAPPQGENYIVIEAKKEGVSHDWDRQKLTLYKDQLGYRYAFLIIVPMSLPAKNLESYVRAVE